MHLGKEMKSISSPIISAHPFITSVILNSNRRDDTLACLRSLAESTYERLSVMVLDNASTDGSVEAIRAEFPEVQIVPLSENKGYAGNNNVGISLALEQGADWVLVLNEDTLLAPNCIEHLVAAGESDPRVGIVGPMVYHADEPNVIQSAGGIFDVYWRPKHVEQNEPDVGQFANTRSVGWISGCALMIRRETVENIGLLDERFFYYWEETEWCFRAQKHGWQILHVPQAKLWHKGVQRDYRPSPAVTYYNTRNRLLFLSKHRASLLPWLVAWFEILRPLASWSLRPKWRSMREHRRASWRGVMDFFHRRWGAVRL